MKVNLIDLAITSTKHIIEHNNTHDVHIYSGRRASMCQCVAKLPLTVLSLFN